VELQDGSRAQQKDNADVYAPLIKYSQGLQTAQGINFSLSNLYQLLAKNRISPRRASVLAYINSLLLRTLPAIDSDKAAGVIDPTAPDSEPKPDATGEFIASPAIAMGKANPEAISKDKTSNTAVALAEDSKPSENSWNPLSRNPVPQRNPLERRHPSRFGTL